LRGCFVLVVAGYDESIPGNPRYSMVGDSASGVFNLRIINASLDDDADFECQVGPEKKHKPIRAAAKLTVIGKSRCADETKKCLLIMRAASVDRKAAGPHQNRVCTRDYFAVSDAGECAACARMPHLHLSLTLTLTLVEYN
jgi:hypothetical protein